jgi:hypothetical protein
MGDLIWSGLRTHHVRSESGVFGGGLSSDWGTDWGMCSREMRIASEGALRRRGQGIPLYDVVLSAQSPFHFGPGRSGCGERRAPMRCLSLGASCPPRLVLGVGTGRTSCTVCSSQSSPHPPCSATTPKGPVASEGQRTRVDRALDAVLLEEN